MNTSNPKAPQPGAAKQRRYDESFKREAVALIDGGRKITQLARELGVSHWTLRDWNKLYGAGAAAASQPARSAPLPRQGEASPVELAVQLADLRRELAATQRQRDILKKALAIVGQQDATATT